MSFTSSKKQLCLLYSELDAPTRYRVHHQIEQMHILGIDTQAAEFTQRRLSDSVSACGMLYLYRLPWSWQLDRLVRFAKKNNIPVVFDTDDYVWDPQLFQNCYLERYYTPAEIRTLLDERNRFRSLIRRVDSLIVSTPYLATLAQVDFCQPVFTNENSVSWEMVHLSETARQHYHPDNSWCTLGYFSGHANVHEPDFELILPVLNSILLGYRQTRLHLVGNLDPDLSRFDETVRERIVILPRVNWRDLPQIIARVDINLAPLVANPYTRSKSAVKFIEAALVGTPTVASNLEPYQNIVHGQTGFLATTADEWLNALSCLIENPERRREIGEAARWYVLQNHTTSQQAAKLGSILKMCDAAGSAPCSPSSRMPEWCLIQHTIRNLPRQLYHAVVPQSMRLKLKASRKKFVAHLNLPK